MTAGLLTLHLHVPILLSVLIGGLVVFPFGIIIGLLTIGMGDLYVAVTTLTFGLLIENTLFIRTIFTQLGSGIPVYPADWFSGPRALTYVCIAVFVVVSLFITNIRRSTTGLALSAARSSPLGARTTGISVVHMKVLLAGLGAFVAGIGGGMLAITLGVAIPTNYTTLGAEVWLTILVTQGIRSNGAALAAGLSQTILAGLVLTYLPQEFNNVIPILFGVGAIAMIEIPGRSSHDVG